MRRLVLALLLLAAGAACSEPERRPDVVLVVLDTLRPDRLELYGSKRATAPYLARVADEGAVFRNGFSSSSWTPPATATIATGLYPNSHGVVFGFMTNKRLERALEARGTVEVELARLPAEQPTLAERFRAAGYATYAVTTNVNIRRDLGFARGFDEFVHEHEADARRTLEIVRGFDFPEDRPTFLYLHLNDPHKPFHARSPWYERYCAEDGAQPLGDDDEPTPEDTVRRYDSEISFADDALRELHAELGWNENTVLAFTSDHGEGFGEHGVFGHGPTLHNLINRSLFLFRGPGVPAGADSDQHVSLVDVYPTLLELAGVAPPERLQGVSLVASMTGAASEERVLFGHRRNRERPPRFLWFAQRGPWKLVYDEASGGSQLYHLGEDPGEERDLSTEQPEIAAELAAAREEFERLGGRTDGGITVEMDAELSDHLREIGYTGD